MTTPERLEIQRGLPFPDNPNEPEYELIDLINGQSAEGLTIQSIWSPNIAAPENGGVWATSAGLEGRKPLSLQTGNVQEIIQLELNSQTQTQIAKFWTKLQRWISEARDFGTTYAQTQPYYLHWQPAGGLSQYALIYNMNATMRRISFSGELYQTNVTIDLEREGAWRALPPGDNPKRWALRLNGVAETTTNLDLLQGSNDLINTSVENKHEYSTTISVTQNWIDIPASLVPGDAPALAHLVLDSRGDDGAIIGISTVKNPDLPTFGAVGNFLQALSLNGADADNKTYSVTNLTVAQTLGTVSTGLLRAPGTPGAGSYYYLQVTTSASGSATTTITWGESNVRKTLSQQMFRGRFAFFVRGGYASGTTGGLSGRFIIGNPLTETSRTVGEFDFSDSAPSVLTYIGDAEIPPVSRSVMSSAGIGTYIPNDISTPQPSSLRFNLEITSSAVNSVYHIKDIIAIPINYGSVLFPGIIAGDAVIDTSGYITRAEGEASAVYDSDEIARQSNSTINNFTLLPNTQQRIFIITYEASNKLATVDSPTTVALNIVPRWYGVRDE